MSRVCRPEARAHFASAFCRGTTNEWTSAVFGTILAASLTMEEV